MNPCVDYCYLRLNKQYDESCDNVCDYAKEVKKRKELEQKVNMAVIHIKSMCTSDGLIRAEIVQSILEDLKANISKKEPEDDL